MNKAKELGGKAMDAAKQGINHVKEKHGDTLRRVGNVAKQVADVGTIGAKLVCGAIGCASKAMNARAGKGGAAAADVATDLMPGVSTVKDGCSCVTGTNPVSGEKMSGAERGIACASAAVDVAGAVAAPFTGGASAAGAYALKTGLKGAAKQGAKQFAKNVAREAAEGAAKAAAKQAAEQAAKQAGKTAAKEAAQAGATKAVQKAVKEAAEKAARESAEKALKANADKPVTTCSQSQDTQLSPKP